MHSITSKRIQTHKPGKLENDLQNLSIGRMSSDRGETRLKMHWICL